MVAKSKGFKFKIEDYKIITSLVFCCFYFSSCSQVKYDRVGERGGQGYERRAISNTAENSGATQNSTTEKPEYKVVYRKSNLETLAIGRNRIEIEELMGTPEGKSLDGGNGYLWDYRRPVLDEVTGEIYGWSLISFKFLKGLCAYVNIRLEQPPPEELLQQSFDQKFDR